MTGRRTPLFKDLEIKLGWKLKRGRQGLRSFLLREGKTRWLDIGASSTFEDGFSCVDWVAPRSMTPEQAERFYVADVKSLTDSDLERMGQYDLVRMQHVFEHFSFEDGLAVLINCSKLLAPNGYLLMTVPDLELFIRYYKNRSFNPFFFDFARERLPEDAPPSCFFSVFAHSFGYRPVGDSNIDDRNEHRWCYDYEGLAYQIKRTGKFKNIQRLGFLNPMASTPFTHNRPAEDLCVLAQKL